MKIKNLEKTVLKLKKKINFFSFYIFDVIWLFVKRTL